MQEPWLPPVVCLLVGQCQHSGGGQRREVRWLTLFRQGLPLHLELTSKPASLAPRPGWSWGTDPDHAHLFMWVPESKLLTVKRFPPSPHLYICSFLLRVHPCLWEGASTWRSVDNVQAAGSFLPPIELSAIEFRSTRLARQHVPLPPAPSWVASCLLFGSNASPVPGWPRTPGPRRQSTFTSTGSSHGDRATDSPQSHTPGSSPDPLLALGGAPCGSSLVCQPPTFHLAFLSEFLSAVCTPKPV